MSVNKMDELKQKLYCQCKKFISNSIQIEVKPNKDFTCFDVTCWIQSDCVYSGEIKFDEVEDDKKLMGFIRKICKNKWIRKERFKDFREKF